MRGRFLDDLPLREISNYLKVLIEGEEWGGRIGYHFRDVSRVTTNIGT